MVNSIYEEKIRDIIASIGRGETPDWKVISKKYKVAKQTAIRYIDVAVKRLSVGMENDAEVQRLRKEYESLQQDYRDRDCISMWEDERLQEAYNKFTASVERYRIHKSLNYGSNRNGED